MSRTVRSLFLCLHCVMLVCLMGACMTVGSDAESPRSAADASAQPPKGSGSPDAGTGAPVNDAGPGVESNGGPSCGDGMCAPEESCFLCETDCGACAPDGVIRVPQDQPTIQSGIDAAASGDIVLVSPGTYEETLAISGKVITLASDFYATGDEGAIENTIIDGGGANVITVDASAGPGTTIVGFTIRNGTDGISGYAVMNVVRNRFTLHSDAIDYEGGGGLCRGNEFWNNSDDALDLDGPTAVIVENNFIHDNDDDGIEIREHDYSGPTLSIVIRNNRIVRSGEDAIQIMDYDNNSDRTYVISGNLIAESAMAGLGIMPADVTSEDYSAAPMPEEIRLFNNTFVDNNYGVTGGANIAAANNIFASTSQVALKGVTGSSVVAYTLFDGNGTDSQGSNVDAATKISGNPQFVGDDYEIAATSPAVDVGTALFEYEGTVVLELSLADYAAAGPDLGWFEVGGD